MKKTQIIASITFMVLGVTMQLAPRHVNYCATIIALIILLGVPAWDWWKNFILSKKQDEKDKNEAP